MHRHRFRLFLAAFIFFFGTLIIFDGVRVEAVYTGTAAGEDTPKTIRLEGKDRYMTAIEISKYGWPDSSAYAVLARGDEFPDALCAAPLAKKYDAPILLTAPGKLNLEVLEELKRLEAGTVFIVGGEGAVSRGTEETLESEGFEVERIGGKDRYETSVRIAERVETQGVIALATGLNYPDALSVSAIAASKGMPILLTSTSKLPDAVRGYIEDRNISETYIIGGTGAIGDDILESVPGGRRISGKDRYDTNAAVMREFQNNLKFNNIIVAVADGPTGREFADALAGSALAAMNSSPVVLVYKTLPQVIGEFLMVRLEPEVTVTALGGTAVVPQIIVQSILDITNLPADNTVKIWVSEPETAIRVGETKQITVESVPGVINIKAAADREGVVSISVSGKTITLKGLSRGSVTITVTGEREGLESGTLSFTAASPVYNAARDRYYDTIQGAVDESSSGHIINIAPGIYKEHLNITRNNLKLVGTDRDTTVIDATQDGRTTRAGIKIKNYSGIEVKNLTVKNAGINTTGERTREPYGIFLWNSDKNVFDNIRLQGNGTYELYMFEGCDNNTIQNSIIDGSGQDGAVSLDGIFSCGGEGQDGDRSLINTANRFMKNTVSNVVYGISLTASNSNSVLDNTIHASDSFKWRGYESAGVVLSNSSSNTITGNNIDTAKYGIRLSTLADSSSYGYAGAPSFNTMEKNDVDTVLHGIRIMGSSNVVENNHITGNSGDGIWLADSAKYTRVWGNILSSNDTGITVDNVSNDIHYNRITGGTTGIRNTSSMMLDADRNSWGETIPRVSGYVSYSPWLEYSTRDNPLIDGFQPVGPLTWCTTDSLGDAVDAASDGDTVKLLGHAHYLDSQLVIDKDLVIMGEGKENTIVKINFNTGNSGDGRGAILVENRRELELSNLTIDGSDSMVMEALRVLGTCSVKGVEIRNVFYQRYYGWGISTGGYADVTVTGSSFKKIEGPSIGVYENAIASIGGQNGPEGNTFIGSGTGDYNQYAVHVSSTGGSPRAAIKGNMIANYAGTNMNGIWTSSGINIESGTATVNNNVIDSCPEGMKVWTGSAVNGMQISAEGAEAEGKTLEGANTASGDTGNLMKIYDKSSGMVLYPLPDTSWS